MTKAGLFHRFPRLTWRRIAEIAAGVSLIVAATPVAAGLGMADTVLPDVLRGAGFGIVGVAAAGTVPPRPSRYDMRAVRVHRALLGLAVGAALFGLWLAARLTLPAPDMRTDLQTLAMFGLFLGTLVSVAPAVLFLIAERRDPEMADERETANAEAGVRSGFGLMVGMGMMTAALAQVGLLDPVPVLLIWAIPLSGLFAAAFVSIGREWRDGRGSGA
jgi:hypothetical protein